MVDSRDECHTNRFTLHHPYRQRLVPTWLHYGHHWSTLVRSLQHAVTTIPHLDLLNRFEYQPLFQALYSADCHEPPGLVRLEDRLVSRAPDPIRLFVQPQSGWYWRRGVLYLNNPFIRSVTVSLSGIYYVGTIPDTASSAEPCFLKLNDLVLAQPLIHLQQDGNTIRISVSGYPYELPDSATLWYTPVGCPDGIRCITDRLVLDLHRTDSEQPLLELLACVVGHLPPHRSLALHLTGWHGMDGLWNPFVPPLVFRWDGAQPLVLPKGVTNARVAELPRYIVSEQDRSGTALLSHRNRYLHEQYRLARNGNWIDSVVPGRSLRRGDYRVVCLHGLWIEQQQAALPIWTTQQSLRSEPGTERYARTSSVLRCSCSVSASMRSGARPSFALSVVELITSCVSTPARAVYGLVRSTIELGVQATPTRGTVYMASASTAVSVAAAPIQYGVYRLATAGTSLQISALVSMRGFPRPVLIQVSARAEYNLRRAAWTDTALQTVCSVSAIRGRYGRIGTILVSQTATAGYRIRNGDAGSALALSAATGAGSRIRARSLSVTMETRAETSPNRRTHSGLRSSIGLWHRVGGGGTRSASAPSTLQITCTAVGNVKGTSIRDASCYSLLEVDAEVRLFRYRPATTDIAVSCSAAATAEKYADLQTVVQLAAQVAGNRSAAGTLATALQIDVSCAAERKRTVRAESTVALIPQVGAVASSKVLAESVTGLRVLDSRVVGGSREPAPLFTTVLGSDIDVTVTDPETLSLLNQLYPGYSLRSQLALWIADRALFVLDADPLMYEVSELLEEVPPTEQT